MFRHYIPRTCLLLPLALSALPATAGDIQFLLEEPTNGSVYSGVANVRGWAVSSVGVRNIELLVDGVVKTNIPSGGLRKDVGNVYPNYPNSSQSGFSMAFNYSELTAGSHTIGVNVVDNDGIKKSTTASFTVARFNTPYISDPAKVSLSAATITDDNDKAISISNLQADGKAYNVRLEWRTAAQGFALTSISPVGGGGDGNARWSALTNACCTTGSLTYQVTIDGVTKSSIASSCSVDPSFEGFASATAGAKSYFAKVTSSACNVNQQASGNVTLVKDACYQFQLALESGSLVNKFGSVTCPSSTGAQILQQETEATPMAIFPMQAEDPSSAGQENWSLLKNIVQP